MAVARRALAIVGEALMSAEDPPAYIRRAAGNDAELLDECLSLIRADRTSHQLLDQPPLESPSSPDLRPALERLHVRPPGEVGGYAIREVLGAGATAIVYRAVDKTNGTEVALKVIPCLTETRHFAPRFEAETESLSRLWHPGIVRIFAAGVDDTPDGHLLWIAMELVKGVPITAFARSRNLSVDDRIGLIIRACDAISDAHRHGIIHRDIKPTNLLAFISADGVAPVVKVVDFGVSVNPAARLVTDPAVGRAMVVGTLEYMAPEQISPGEADVRGDIYSLSAVLYELLAGRPPVDLRSMDLTSALRAVLHPAPPRLRTLAPGVSRALEAVVHKGLAASSRQRYSSLSDLAADLERALSGLPVSAKPTTIAEQLRMAWRARPVLLASVAVAIVSLSIGGTVAMTNLLRARRAEASRRAQVDSLHAFVGSLAKVHINELAKLPRSDALRESMLRQFEETLRQDFDRLDPGGSDSPALRRAYATVLESMGDICTERARREEERRLRDRVISILDPLCRASPGDAELQADFSIALVKRGDLEVVDRSVMSGKEYYLRALALDERLAEENPGNRRLTDNLVRSYSRLAQREAFFPDAAEGVRMSRRALELAEALAAANPGHLTSLHAVLEARTCLAKNLLRHGDRDAAEAEIVAALQLGRVLCREEPANRGFATDFLLAVVAAIGMTDVSSALFDQAVRDALARCDAISLLNPDDVEWLLGIGNMRIQLGDELARQQQSARAIEVYVQGLQAPLPSKELDHRLVALACRFADRLMEQVAPPSPATVSDELRLRGILQGLSGESRAKERTLACEASVLRAILSARLSAEASVAGALAVIDVAMAEQKPAAASLNLARAEVLLRLGRTQESARAVLQSSKAPESSVFLKQFVLTAGELSRGAAAQD